MTRIGESRCCRNLRGGILPPSLAHHRKSNKLSAYSEKQREYNNYLQSHHWMQVRLRYRQGHKYRCFACPKKKDLQLHHRTYERIGAELDSDLVYLCGKCHGKIHRLARSKSKKDRQIDISNGPEALRNRIATRKVRRKRMRARRKARAKERLDRKNSEESDASNN